MFKKLRNRFKSPPPPTEEQEMAMEEIIKKSVLAAIFLGFLVTAYLIVEGGEPFSALYIKPESYQNYINDSEASFIYGVFCYEGKPTDYMTEIFLDNESIGANSFMMSEGNREWQMNFPLPQNTSFPVKVTVVLKTEDTVYETHYWIKGKL